MHEGTVACFASLTNRLAAAERDRDATVERHNTLAKAVCDWHADEDDDGSKFELVLKLAGAPIEPHFAAPAIDGDGAEGK
jgi:hypothetical protein